MSHNITKWKTKRVEGLILPLQPFYNAERFDNRPYAPHLEDPENGLWWIKWGDELWMRGTITDGDKLNVTQMSIQGPWSEHIYFDVLIPALEQSRGHLEAVLTWANGDSISRLTVSDGTIKDEQVEL